MHLLAGAAEISASAAGHHLFELIHDDDDARGLFAGDDAPKEGLDVGEALQVVESLLSAPDAEPGALFDEGALGVPQAVDGEAGGGSGSPP